MVVIVSIFYSFWLYIDVKWNVKNNYKVFECRISCCFYKREMGIENLLIVFFNLYISRIYYWYMMVFLENMDLIFYSFDRKGCRFFWNYILWFGNIYINNLWFLDWFKDIFKIRRCKRVVVLLCDFCIIMFIGFFEDVFNVGN